MDAKANDIEIIKIKIALKSRTQQTNPAYTLRQDGLLLYKPPNSNTPPRVIVPYSLQRQILRLTHDKAAHFGRHKMLNILEKRVYWKYMHQDVRAYVKACSDCYNASSSPSTRYKP
jgi:hypothetical protein